MRVHAGLDVHGRMVQFGDLLDRKVFDALLIFLRLEASFVTGTQDLPASLSVHFVDLGSEVNLNLQVLD